MELSPGKLLAAIAAAIFIVVFAVLHFFGQGHVGSSTSKSTSGSQVSFRAQPQQVATSVPVQNSVSQQPTSTPIDTEGLSSISEPSYMSQVPEHNYSQNYPSSVGKDSQSIKNYSSKDAQEFTIIKTDDFSSHDDENVLGIADKKNWVPVLSTFANTAFRTFTDQEKAQWHSTMSSILNADLANQVESADLDKVKPAMPTSIKIAKTGQGYVTAVISYNNGTTVVASVHKESDSTWKINYYN